MNVHGTHFRTIWLKPDDPAVVQIIDQRQLPFAFVVEELRTVDDMAVAIKDMHVRGAGLIGAAAGYGMLLATRQAPRTSAAAFRAAVEAAGAQLKATRPTAVNLAWAVDRQLAAMDAAGSDIDAQMMAVEATARIIADEDADFCRRIGEHGVALIEEISPAQGRRAGQRADALQRRLAGLCRLRHGHRAHLRRARSRHPGARVGG